MFRRILILCCFAYLLVAFSFTMLAMLNADSDGSLVYLLDDDAQVIAVMSLIGLGVTILLAVRIMIDGRYQRDLEHRVYNPRRKSDVAGDDFSTDKE